MSFGLSNEMMVTFKEENLMTFRHLFLKGYKDHRSGSYALYTQADVYDHIYYIINKVPTFYLITLSVISQGFLCSIFLSIFDFFFSTSVSRT